MYGIYIYANIWGILMVNVTIYSIHGSYGIWFSWVILKISREIQFLKMASILRPTNFSLGEIAAAGAADLSSQYLHRNFLFHPGRCWHQLAQYAVQPEPWLQ